VSRRARVAAGAPLGALAIFVLLHFTRPELDPARRAVSDYARGPGGALATFAFVLLGAGSFALAGELRGISRVAPALLRFSGACVFGVALFPVPQAGDPPNLIQLASAAHGTFAFLSFSSLILAMLVCVRGFARTAHWRRQARPTLLTALAAIVLQLNSPNYPRDVAGFWERVYLALLWGWLAYIGARAAARSTR